MQLEQQLARIMVESGLDHFKAEQASKRMIDFFNEKVNEAISKDKDWTSVDDQLPEVGEFVLVCNTEGSILKARLFNDGWMAYFSDGEKPMNELTALYWRPLPIAPIKNSKP